MPAPAGRPNVNAAIRGPQMLEQQSNLRVTELKHLAWEVFLVGPLIVNSQALEPTADAFCHDGDRLIWIVAIVGDGLVP